MRQIVALADDAAHAQLLHAAQQRRVANHGADHHRALGMPRAQPRQQLHAVGRRVAVHVVIGDDDIAVGGLEQRQQRMAVVRLRDDLLPGKLLDGGGQSHQDDGMVVCGHDGQER